MVDCTKSKRWLNALAWIQSESDLWHVVEMVPKANTPEHMLKI